MAIARWNPPVQPSVREQRVLKRLTRVRKLFAFLRLHRHEILDEAFQDELAAIRLVAALFDSGELPPRQMALRLQGSLLHQLRRIWRARELLSAGTPARDLAGALGVPPFAVDELLGPARRATVATLAGDFQRLYRADRALKSSRTDPKVYLTRLVRSLCGVHA